MRVSIKGVLIGVLATLILTTAVGSASARNLSVSNQNIRIVWRELLLIAEPLNNNCEVTIEGSFHSRTIPKMPGTLVGYITRAAVAHCSVNTSVGLHLPWHIRYRSFSGALPNITRVRLDFIEVSFLVEISLFRCLYRSTPARPVLGELLINGAHVVTGLALDETGAIPLWETLAPSLSCPEFGALTGTGTVTLLAATTPITLTLI